MDMLQETEDATAVAEISAEKSERSYLSSYSIKQDLQKLQNEMPKINITLEVIGRTLEYQDIIMLRISESKESSKYFRADDNRYAEEVPEKKIIFIVHGLSVMGMASLPCLSSLTAFKTLFSFYTAHLDKFDIFFIPMANPDGFAHTWTYSSYWNKNVAPQSECPGVSLDRNFEVAWENNRTISSCSQEYPGPEPFSEEETRAIRDVFHKYAHKIIAYLNVHAGSYSSSVFRGDAVLYPKGYSENAVDDDKYIDLKGEIDEAIRNASFQVLSVAVESLYNWYGKITGTSVDYASTIYGIPYALELVMQHYEDGSDSANSNSEYYTDLALTEVWKRIIDVIFGYVWKSVHALVGVMNVGCGNNNKYDDYTLVKLFPTKLEQIEALKILEVPGHDIEVLKKSRSFNDSTDVLVPPEEFKFIQDFIKHGDIVHEIKSHYGRKFENLDRTPKRRLMRSFSIYEYNGFTAIQEYLESMAKQHPDLMKLQNLGTSYQGRRMKLVKISSDPSACNPIIFVDAGIHAREWVAPAMAMYIIHRLVNDPNAKQELNGVDWYILPVVNPDGYEFTRTSRANRLWRKTRSKHSSYDCYGVDGNRNYGFKWAVSGVSKNPCDKETYAGPKPFSEIETQIVRNIMMDNSKRMKLYVSLHSYGQYLVYPWGYTGDYLPKEWKRLDSLAKRVSDAVERAGGQPFKVLSAGKWYPAAGGSDDFAFGAVGVPYSYTMELTDGFEFIFPEKRLRSVMPQFYEGFKAFAAQIRDEFPSPCQGRRFKGSPVDIGNS